MLKFELIEDFTKLKAGDPVYFGKGGTPYKFLVVFEDRVWVINGYNKAESTATTRSRNDWFRGIEVKVTERFSNLYKSGEFGISHPGLAEAQRAADSASHGHVVAHVKITFHGDKPVKVELINR